MVAAAPPCFEWSLGFHEYLGEEPTDTGSRLLRKETLYQLQNARQIDQSAATSGGLAPCDTVTGGAFRLFFA